MAFEQRNNTGTLGRNKNKVEDKHPDHKGSAIIDGVEYWVSAWIKQNGTTGDKFFSLSYQKKEMQNPTQRSNIDSIDDDIPF